MLDADRSAGFSSVGHGGDNFQSLGLSGGIRDARRAHSCIGSRAVNAWSIGGSPAERICQSNARQNSMPKHLSCSAYHGCAISSERRRSCARKARPASVGCSHSARAVGTSSSDSGLGWLTRRSSHMHRARARRRGRTVNLPIASDRRVSMTDDNIKKLLEMTNVSQHLDSLSCTLAPITENPALRSIVDELKRREDVLRLAHGPLEQLRRAGLLDTPSPLQREFDLLCTTLAERFVLPEIAQAAKLVEDWKLSATGQAVKRFHEHASQLTSAMQGMRVPWLDVEQQLRSVSGFIELQNIGLPSAIHPHSIPAWRTKFASNSAIGVTRLHGQKRFSPIRWPGPRFTERAVSTLH